MCRPEAPAEGSLGTCVPRDVKNGRAVPNEARDVSLMLGKTRKKTLGKTKMGARQDGVGDFFEQPRKVNYDYQFGKPRLEPSQG
jgi:uncharacterized protein (UPF0264 family)